MKNFKRIASLVLALTMILCMGLPIFADGETTTSGTTLTINTTAGHTYKVYQLLKGDVSNLSNGSGTLSDTAVGENMKASTSVDQFLAAIKDTNGNYLANEELGNKAYEYITGDPKYTVTGDGSAVETTVENGYYIVVDTWTSTEPANDVLSRYMVAVVGPTTMTPKATKPDIDKDIIDDDANTPIENTDNKVNTAAIGDTIQFEITGTVPDTEGYTYYYYVVHDTMSKGLTLNDKSFVVTIGDDNTLTEDTDYFVYKDDAAADGSVTFRLAFADLKSLVDNDEKDIDVGETISIKYSATVNDNAVIGVDPNTNKAKLEYSNEPGSSTKNHKDNEPGVPKPGTATGEGTEKTTNTYVTELNIQKVNEKNMPLAGAQFTLTGTNLKKVIITTATEFRKPSDGEIANYYELNDGTFTTAAPSTAAEGEEGYNANLYKNPDGPTHVRVTTLTPSTEAEGDPKAIVGTVDAAGKLTFTGLNVGEYTLKETVTPEGYNTMSDIKFEIRATVNNSNIVWSSTNENIVLDAANGVFDATIENIPGSNLPSTGGIGTTIFYIAGGVLLVGAAVLLITKRRMNING